MEENNSFKILSLVIANPKLRQIPIKDNGDCLININNANNPRIVSYKNLNKTPKTKYLDNCKIRKGLYEKILILLENLPQNIGIAVFEGYRPLWKQKQYFEIKFKNFVKQYGTNNFEKAYAQTCKFVSPFIDNIPPHCTGGAIDFSLFKFDKNDKRTLLDLGKTGILHTNNNQAQTLDCNITTKQKQNRTML
ncbi:hypothetical protein K9L05_04025 [Candidatus Babeliales bacterium]|nr:hypothetical protein [Candidatus Babeliales bacterium]MCF7899783.1 hypothetical protein [Candidatus Babeliales bacterium]